MANNTNGKNAFDKLKTTLTPAQKMAMYDALPREYRDVLKDSVDNILVTNPEHVRRSYKTPRFFSSWIKQKELLGTRDTYGINHPAVAYK